MDTRDIDIESLREDLMDYFGTAMTAGFGAATVDLNTVRNASERELISIAVKNGFDLSNYRTNENEYDER